MAKKLLFQMIVVALLAALMAGCEKSAPPQLVFGASAWPGYEPVYLAGDLGYFSAANLRLAEYPNPSEVRQAFRGGTLHLAAMTLEDALLLRRDVPDLKIVLIFDSAGASGPARRFDVLVTRDEYLSDYHRDMAQLGEGWRRSLDYIHTERAKAMLAMAKHEHIDPAQFDKAMQGIELFDAQRNREMLLGQNPAMVSAIESAQRAMMDKGMLNVGVDPTMLLDASLVAGTGK